jgi:UDP-glucuronate 4-epimerase
VGEIPKGNVLNTYANINKARKLLGYKPKVKIKEGLTNTFKWYMENDQ